jgi:hypothetical protein
LAYLCSKLLQTDGGLCHPALASLLCSDYLRQGPFAPRALPRFFAHTDPSVRLSPSPRFALGLARLPCFRGFSPRGGRPSLFSPMTLSACCRPLPRRAVPPQIAFGVACCLRQFLDGSAPGVSSSRGLVQTFTHRCGPRPCLPRHAGLCRWASPPGSPMSAPPKLCGFDLLPTRDFHPMASWVPPGITRDLKRHFAFTESHPRKTPITNLL